MSHKSQCLKLIPYLRSERGITSLEASRNLCITSLHRRLTDLEEMGCTILRKPIHQNGVHFNRYFATKVPKWLLEQVEGKAVTA